MEDKNYKELTEFIGEQFDKVYGEFDKVHNEFGSVYQRLDSLEDNFHQLQTAVDNYAHKADTYFMEMAALGSKVDRLERWINQVAEKVGVKLGS